MQEWHEFLSKDGVLGMQSRFLTFHSSPRLDKAADMLDSDVYQANDEEAPAPTDSLLQKLLQVLTCTDRAHVSDKDYFLFFVPQTRFSILRFTSTKGCCSKNCPTSKTRSSLATQENSNRCHGDLPSCSTLGDMPAPTGSPRCFVEPQVVAERRSSF